MYMYIKYSKQKRPLKRKVLAKDGGKKIIFLSFSFYIYTYMVYIYKNFPLIENISAFFYSYICMYGFLKKRIINDGIRILINEGRFKR